jgi:hypothetical protein
VSEGVRSGGRAVLANGTILVWSLAEGRRGRRWRESLTNDRALRRSMLLEVTPAGRPTRLEVASAAGLLTLHPDADGRELHGNVVTSTGIRHLRFEWGFEHDLFVVGSPTAAAVTLRRLADLLAVGEARAVPVVWVDDALEPRPGAWQVTRTAPDGWHLRDLDGTEVRILTVDTDGIAVLPGSASWPLELD